MRHTGPAVDWILEPVLSEQKYHDWNHNSTQFDILENVVLLYLLYGLSAIACLGSLVVFFPSSVHPKIRPDFVCSVICAVFTAQLHLNSNPRGYYTYIGVVSVFLSLVIMIKSCSWTDGFYKKQICPNLKFNQHRKPL